MNELRKLLRTLSTLLLLLQHGLFADAITLDLNSIDNIKSVASALAFSTMSYYHGNESGQTPGLLPASGQWSWWEAGALMGQMVEYWYYTGDDTYNNVTTQALLFQTGPDGNYEPANQTRVEGNDDQAFWAFSVMSAAEFKFPNPPPGDYQWLALAQAVFNRQAGRWDAQHCGGGLRWQFNPLNNGWMNKNTISNGCFFQLAARLARYTGNDTYATWANTTYDWLISSHLIGSDYTVYDSIGFTDTSCSTTPGQLQWSYNIGTMIAGCAFMYNYTNGSSLWGERLQGYLNHTQAVFFPAEYGGKTMMEYACEPPNTCNTDQRSFKAYLSRWLAVTTQLAPFTIPQITPWLQTSAQNAARICTGDPNNPTCGRKWYVATNDGTTDVGNQMTAMSIVQSNLIWNVQPPLGVNTGGISPGNPGAGGGGGTPSLPGIVTRPILQGDKGGAWFLTVLSLIATAVFAWFMVSDDDPKTRHYTGSRLHRSAFHTGGKWGHSTARMSYGEAMDGYASHSENSGTVTTGAGMQSLHSMHFPQSPGKRLKRQ